MKKRNLKFGILAALIAVQLFDVAVHVSIGQAEPIRIVSNIILGLWALWSVFGTADSKTGIVAIASYLVLNFIFVALHGVTNPDQGGALRVALFVLVGLSTALSIWLQANTRRAWVHWHG